MQDILAVFGMVLVSRKTVISIKATYFELSADADAFDR